MKRSLQKTALLGAILLLILSLRAPAMASWDSADYADEVYQVGTGEKVIYVEMMEGQYTIDVYLTLFEVHTDESTLWDALLAVDLIEGESVPRGFNVTAVNDREADYTYGEYWHLYRYGEEGMVLDSGIGEIPISDGDGFMLSPQGFWTMDEAEDEDIMVANSCDLPWPKGWPSELPKPEGRIVAYFGDESEASEGFGVSLEGVGMSALETYLDSLVQQGYTLKTLDPDEDYPSIFALTGKDCQIILSTFALECSLYVIP